jgi:hypothetical protein
MKELELTVRISRDGEYENTENYDISIPADTSDEDEMEVMMDELRPLIEEEYEGDDDWDDGNIDWELVDWNEY